MKRPLGILGISYLSALVLGLSCGRDLALCVAFLGVILFLISLCIKPLRQKKTIPVICMTAVFALFSYCIAYTLWVTPVQALDGSQATITATLTKQPYQKGSRIYYPVKTTKVNLKDAPQEIDLLLSTDTYLDMDYYDTVTCDVVFYTPDSGSFKNYYAAKGIYISCYTTRDSTFSITPNQDKPLSYYPLKINESLSEQIDEYLPAKQAALAKALFLGNKNGLDSELRTAFSQAGIAHIIVVSGLHLSVLTSFIYLLVQKLSRSKRIAAVVSLAVVLTFMTITGFSPSVVRAGIMMSVFMAGKLFNKVPDSINSLGLAALVLGVVNPMCGGDIGMLMSFTSTLGIVVLSPKLVTFAMQKVPQTARGYRFIQGVASALCVSLAAVVFSFPVTFLAFGTFNLYFLLSNLLITCFTPVVLVSIMGMALFSYLPFLHFITYAFAFAAGIFCNYFIFIAEFVAILPFAVLDIAKPSVYLWFILTLVLFAVMLIRYKGKPRHLGMFSALSLAVLLLTSAVFGLFTNNVTTLTVLHTAGGNTAVVQKGEQSVILSCGGARGFAQDTLYTLKDLAPEPELLIVPDKEKQNSYYATNIVNQFDVKNILVYDTNKYGKALQTELNALDNVTEFRQEFAVSLWDNGQISLYTQEDITWVLAAFEEITVLLCPVNGDASHLPKEMRQADLAVMSRVPKNMELLEAADIILTTEEEVLPKQFDLLKKMGKSITCTFMGNVAVQPSFDGKITLKQAK